jgi:hypothetical protein
MADDSLLAVDHQPEFDHSLMPVDHDPFADTGTDAAAQAQQGSRLLASQNLRDLAAFDPNTYAPTDVAQQIASRQPGLARGLFDMGRELYALPQRAIQNSQVAVDTANYDPSAPMEAAMTVAGAAPMVGAEMRTGQAVLKAPRSTLESRSSLMYNPPAKRPRPFGEDYKTGVSGEPGSPLLVDNRGTALTAENIVGRRTVGGADEALTPEGLDNAATSLLGSQPEAVEAGSLPRGSVGGYREVRTDDGPERTIKFLRSLDPSAAQKVVAHELGHAIDEMSGQIPTAGLNTELRRVYNTLSTGRERTTQLMGPQHLGYSEQDVPVN